MTSDDDDLNAALDDEDNKAIAALTVDDVAAIDEAILYGSGALAKFVQRLKIRALSDRVCGSSTTAWLRPLRVGSGHSATIGEFRSGQR